MSTEGHAAPAGPALSGGETGPRPAAVLWDMDGTLVDTEPYWIATEEALAAERGVEWTRQDALALVGNDLLDSGRYIKDRMALEETPEQVVQLLLDGVIDRLRQGIPWRPGARELLTRLRADGVPCALVTMSWERFAAPIVAQLPGGFDVVVTGDRITRGKPHPDPYLAAAAELGVAAGDCVAIEDSGTGAASAAAAGCTVLVVENHVAVPEGERRVFRSTLTGLDTDQLGELMR